MASTLVRRTCLQHSKPCYTSNRGFTRSAPALKKRRSASSVDVDDLFAPSTHEDDLFSSAASRPSMSSSNKSGSAFQKPSPRKSAKAQDATAGKSAQELFEEHYTFMMDRLGHKPLALHPQVRYSGLQKLLHHSREPEQLERVLEALAQWRNSGRVVDEQTAIEIIDRFLAWQPALILKLVADKPKFGVTLPTIADARRILRRLVLYRSHPLAQSTDVEAKKKANAEALKNAATFAAFLPTHGLGKATEDTVCCALLAQACARNLMFSETLEKKKAEREGNGNEAEPASSPVPPVKRAPLGSASTRGLLSISSSLATLLATDRILPDPSKPQRRMSGATQSESDERLWISASLRDVIRALQTVHQTNPSLGLVKKNLEVLEKALNDLTGGEAPQL